MLKTIANGLSELPMVKSVALSGSKTSAINDNFSDLDIYVYSDNHVPFEDRARIFSGFESVRINCSPFEEGDEIIDKCGNVSLTMYGNAIMHDSAIQHASYTISAHLK